MSADVGSRTVEIFDTTLRDGAQLEGISLTVDDKLRIAEQLDHLGVHWIEGGWPGGQPEGRGVLPPGRRPSSTSRRRRMVAFGSTRRVKGKVDDDPTLANLVAAGTSAVCIVGKSWDYHVTDALGTTLDEGAAMVGDSVEYPPRPRTRRDVRRRALLRRLQAQPRVRAAGARSGGSQRSRPPRAVRHERRVAAVRDRADRRRGRPALPRRRHDRDPHPRRHRVRGGKRSRRGRCRCGPGAGHDQRHRRAHRQLQPHDGHPEPVAEDGHRDDPADRMERLTSGRPPHRRARQRRAEPAGPVRGRLRVRAQGRPARERDREAVRRATSTFSPTASATELASWCRSWRARRRSRSRPRSSVSTSTARRSAMSSTRSSVSSTRGTTSRPPTARSSCSCAAPPGGSRTTSRSSRSGSPRTRCRTARS